MMSESIVWFVLAVAYLPWYTLLAVAYCLGWAVCALLDALGFDPHDPEA